jgi:hypothetical protein
MLKVGMNGNRSLSGPKLTKSCSAEEEDDDDEDDDEPLLPPS